MADIGKGDSTLNAMDPPLLRVNEQDVTGSSSSTTGSGKFDRLPKVAIKALTGATVHAGTVGWANPESTDILVSRVLLNITTASTGACTLNVGVGATATTADDTLIDGPSVATAALLDNLNDAGTNGKSRKIVPSGYYVTVTEASGDATGLVGKLYITYHAV